MVSSTCTSSRGSSTAEKGSPAAHLDPHVPQEHPHKACVPGPPLTFSVLLMMVCRGSSSLLSAVCVLYIRTAGMLEAGTLCWRLQRWSICLCRHAAPFAKDTSEDISIHMTSPAPRGALRGPTWVIPWELYCLNSPLPIQHPPFPSRIAFTA